MLKNLKLYGVINYAEGFGEKHENDIAIFNLVYQDPSKKFYHEAISSFKLEKILVDLDKELISDDGLEIVDKKTGLSIIKKRTQNLKKQKENLDVITGFECIDDEIVIGKNDVYLTSSLYHGRISPVEEFCHIDMEIASKERLENPIDQEGLVPSIKGLHLNGCLYIGSREYLIPHLSSYFNENPSISDLAQMNLFTQIEARDEVIDIVKQNKSRKKMTKEELMVLFDAHTFKELEELTTSKKNKR